MLYIWCLKYLLNIWCKISAYWPPCALSVWADVSRHQWGQKITAGLRNLPIFSLEMTLFASKGSLLVLTRLMNCHTSISAKINSCKHKQTGNHLPKINRILAEWSYFFWCWERKNSPNYHHGGLGWAGNVFCQYPVSPVTEPFLVRHLSLSSLYSCHHCRHQKVILL